MFQHELHSGHFFLNTNYEYAYSIDVIIFFDKKQLYRVAQNMYTLFTHQYLWNKLK